MSTPTVPPRPPRSAQQPLVPPRPIRNPDPSPTRSPLNFPPTALANRHPPKRSSQELPRRPPSVSLPDIGHEGDEYSTFDAEDRTHDGSGNRTSDSNRDSTGPGNRTSETDRDSTGPGNRTSETDRDSTGHGNRTGETNRDCHAQTHTVAADLPMHQPRASVPPSTASKNISRVTETDSTTAAGLGIGRSRPVDDVHKPAPESPYSLRARASFTRSTPNLPLDRQTSRPASLYGDDTEHGIPAIGQQIPLNRYAGDAQAPTPSGGQSAHAPGIGFFHDGSAKHHKKRLSRQEFLAHDSYGLEHDENHADQFEREWMKKHPHEAAKEHVYRHLPKPETAMSSAQLNQLIHRTDAAASTPSTPAEEDAIQEYLARLSPHVSDPSPSSRRDPAPDAPSSRTTTGARTLHPDHAAADGDHHRHASRKSSRYDPDEEHSHRDGTPILAADELQKRPGTAFLPPAVVPEPRADDDFYDESGPDHGSRRSSMQVPSRPSSRPGSVPGAPALHAYGGGSLHRFVSHEDVHHSGTGTPLEEIEEYEPLFPEDDQPAERRAAVKKRPDLTAMHHFPSQDVWEDAPSSLQYSAEVSTPDLERPQPELQTTPEDTPAPEHARSTAAADRARREKTGIAPHVTPGLLAEVKASHRPGAHRFPSSDVWEETPHSMLGETTVHTPEADAGRSPPEDRATTAAAALAPSVPSQPPRIPTRSDDGATSPPPTTTTAPSVPAKPSIPARPLRPARGEAVPREQSSSGGRDEPSAPTGKPAVPARPGSKISAMPGNFLTDLNNRLKLGPPAAPPKEEPRGSDEAGREPLVDARKSRAKGPPRRQPAAPPAPDRNLSATFAMSPLITCWTIDDTDELQVPNESDRDGPLPEERAGGGAGAPEGAKILADHGLTTRNAAAAPAPAPAIQVAAEISKSRRPSETAQGHAASAEVLKAALAEAGVGPAVPAIAEGCEAPLSAAAARVETGGSRKHALPRSVVPGSFPDEKDEEEEEEEDEVDESRTVEKAEGEEEEGTLS